MFDFQEAEGANYSADVYVDRDSLSAEYTYYVEVTGRTISHPLAAGGSYASCGPQEFGVHCAYGHQGGDYLENIASEPVSAPVYYYRLPTTWSPPMSPTATQP